MKLSNVSCSTCKSIYVWILFFSWNVCRTKLPMHFIINCFRMKHLLWELGVSTSGERPLAFFTCNLCLFFFFSGWPFDIEFIQTIKTLCNWSLNGMVHVPNDLLSTTSQNLQSYWNKEGNACFCYRYFSETIRHKNLELFPMF